MPIEVHSDTFDGQSTQGPEIKKFLGRRWRFPYFSEDAKWKYHRGYMDAKGSGIGYALRWLGTQISIGEPTILREFPSYPQSVVHGLIHVYRSPHAGFMQRQWNKAANVLDDSRAEEFLRNSRRAGATGHRAFAEWFRLGIYEPSINTVKIKSHGLAGYHLNSARAIRFVADVPYDLVLFVGCRPEEPAPDRPPEDNVIARGLVNGDGVTLAPVSEDRYISTAKLRWFKVGLYVPDAIARMMMDPATLKYYLRITGRAYGEENYNQDEDIYWHLSGWERALEAAKIPMWVVKKGVPTVAKKLVGAVTGVDTASDVKASDKRWRQDEQMRGDGAGDSEAGLSTYSSAVWNGTSKHFNRKSIVPPNYCFVKFNCLLYLRVVVVNPPDAPEFKAARFKEAKSFR